eukprot:COSAG04_NODE_933_length_9342_cov_2.591042_6_plen_94_part_00
MCCLALRRWFVKQFTQGSDHGAPILRMLRMVRIFRILKFGGHVRNLQLFAIGFKRAQEGLVLLLFLLLPSPCVFPPIRPPPPPPPACSTSFSN